MNSKKAKSAARDEAKQIRENLTQADIRLRSQIMLEKFFLLFDLEELKSLHIYMATDILREPLTQPFLDHIWKTHPGLATFMPVVRETEMLAAEIDPATSYKKGAFGLLEPLHFEPVDQKNQFDLIIVPLLAFDNNLNRLGYGKGYYDKFLATQNGIKVGLAYESSLRADGLPTESHDVPLTHIITEERVYN